MPGQACARPDTAESPWAASKRACEAISAAGHHEQHRLHTNGGLQGLLPASCMSRLTSVSLQLLLRVLVWLAGTRLHAAHVFDDAACGCYLQAAASEEHRSGTGPERQRSTIAERQWPSAAGAGN